MLDALLERVLINLAKFFNDAFSGFIILLGHQHRIPELTLSLIGPILRGGFLKVFVVALPPLLASATLGFVVPGFGH